VNFYLYPEDGDRFLLKVCDIQHGERFLLKVCDILHGDRLLLMVCDILPHSYPFTLQVRVNHMLLRSYGSDMNFPLWYK
jgi:hypothetical protein